MGLIAWCIFLLGTAAVGFAVLSGLDRARVIDWQEHLALAFPCGIGFLGALLYTLNVCGIPFGRRLVAALIAAGIVAASASWRRVRACPAPPQHSASAPLSGPGLLALLIALVLVAGFVANSLVYVDWQGDTLMYHLPFAGIVYHTHHQPAFASFAPTEEFSFPPALFESYAAFWSLIGYEDQLFPNLLPALFLVHWVGLTYLFTRRVLHRGADAAAFAVLLFTSLYEMPLLAAGENTDLLPVLFAGGAVYLMARDEGDSRRCRLPAAIYLMGLYSWTKYHGLTFALCAAAVYWLVYGRNRAAFRSAGWVLVGTTAWTLPLLLRNAMMFGNPIYPGGGRWIGGYLATPWAVGVVGGWWQPNGLFHEFPVVLWTCLREPPILLGAPALMLAFRRRSRAEIFVGCCAAATLLLFSAVLSNRTPEPLRFVAPALALFSWLGGALFEENGRDSQAPRRLLAAWCITTLLLVGGITLATHGNAFHLAHGRWLDRDNLIVAGTELFWIFPAALAVFFFSFGAIRRAAPQLGQASLLLFVALASFGHHRPFVQISRDAHIGLLPHPDWRRVPARTPVLKWMQLHLPQKSVIYTFFYGRWMVPAAVLPPDDPLLEPLQQPGLSLTATLEILRRAGVSHILFWNVPAGLKIYQVYRSEPVFRQRTDVRFFHLVKSDPSMALYEIHYPDGRSPCRPTAECPMPWLLDFSAFGPY